MRRLLYSVCALLLATPLAAAELNLTVQIPEQKVAEYHRPYAAIWIERADTMHTYCRMASSDCLADLDQDQCRNSTRAQSSCQSWCR